MWTPGSAPANGNWIRRSRAGRPLLFSIALATLLGFVTPSTAGAELIFFANDRSLSVKGHRVENGRLVIQLRAGGEIVCDPATIVRIAEDEVPHPDPEDPLLRVAAAVEPVSTPADPSSYDPIIRRVAAEQGVDAKLIRAVISVESNYQPRARSRKGAMGLMQLMPETARQYALADPYDPAGNIEAGIKHLKSLLERFPLRLALAAYNAGEAPVTRFGGVPPYPETRAYVRRILELISR